MPLSETVLIIMGLLTVAMLAAGLCRKLSVPYTVVLVVVGIVLGQLSEEWLPLRFLEDVQLSPDLVFFIFLPALIFESGFNLDARQLIKDLPPVLILAVPALVFSTTFIGLGLWLVLDLNLVIALVFGALISATDPVAVIALFKELGAPQRLTVLVDGEALMNDATAIVVFGILLGLAVGGEVGWSASGWAVVDFLRVFFGGALVGAGVGFVISELLYRLRSGLNMILTMSVVIAYASFILAEHVLHVSGVMAAAVAAVVLSAVGVTRMPQEATTAIGEIWEVIALVCNSLLFLLVGLSVELAVLGTQIGAITLAVLLVLAARAASVYAMVPAATRLFALPRVTMGERHIMSWGGLKGGLAIAMVLSIPQDLPGRQLLLDMTVGVVLFTLLVNASTIRSLMRKLGLDRFTEDEWAELKHCLGHAQEQSKAVLDRFHAAEIVSEATYNRAGEVVEKALTQDFPALPEGEKLREVYLTALRTELEEVRRLYDLGVITQYTYFDIRSTLRRDREAHSGASFSATALGSKEENPFLRLEMAMVAWLRKRSWSAGLFLRYQKIRLAQHLQHNVAGVLMCRAVLDKINGQIEFLEEHRRTIARAYEERLRRRKARIVEVRRVFPDFYRRFESRLCNCAGLNSAMGTAHRQHRHGEVGAKAFNNIRRRIQAALENLPPLAEPFPTLKPRELLAKFPLLAGLSVESRDKLARHVRLLTFLPGDIVIREHHTDDALYLVARGEVSLREKGRDTGDMRTSIMSEGGETAIFSGHTGRVLVTATTTTMLLRLSRLHLLALADKDPEIKRRLVKYAGFSKAAADPFP